jgi:hypothetical protein
LLNFADSTSLLESDLVSGRRFVAEASTARQALSLRKLLNLDPVKVGFESRSVDGRRFLHVPL